MDQEPDTTDNTASSRRGRYWLDHDASEPRLGPRTERRGGHPSPPEKTGFREISIQEAARLDSGTESPPTLFELPDRSVKSSKSESVNSELADSQSPLSGFTNSEPASDEMSVNQYAIHDAHSGPPAGHVDPPSGNQSRLSRTGPKRPPGPDSAIPDHSDSTEGSWSDESSAAAPSDAFVPDHASDDRIAAFNHPTPTENAERNESTWAGSNRGTDHRKPWGSHSAIIMSALLMVTLAFFSGRVLHQYNSHVNQTDPDAESLGDTVVVITEDGQPFDESSLADASHAEAIETGTVAGTPGTHGEAEMIARDIPSYIAQTPSPEVTLPATTAPTSPGSSLGEPSVPPTVIAESTGDQAADAAAPEIPTEMSSPDAVVAFRAEQQAAEAPNAVAPNAVAGPSTDELESKPSLGARLRHGDGIRYSDTPHAIGDLLEILRAWETSSQPLELTVPE